MVTSRIGRVLIVDDDPGLRSLLAREFSRHLETVSAADFVGAMVLMRQTEQPLEVVVTDLRLGDGPSGLDLLEAARHLRPSCVRVLVSGEMTDEVATKLAMEDLADAAFGKPWPYGSIASVIIAMLEYRASGDIG